MNKRVVIIDEMPFKIQYHCGYSTDPVCAALIKEVSIPLNKAGIVSIKLIAIIITSARRLIANVFHHAY